MQSKIAVVIVNYNAGDTLLTALRSVFESSIRPGTVVIVDNASVDGSLEKCRAAYPKLAYITNTHNVGFAAGANIGARYALEKMNECVIFINPDATVSKSCIEKLAEATSERNIGIAAPLIYKPQDKSIWFSGGRILHSRQRVVHIQSMPLTKEFIDTEFATGCVMAVSGDLCRNIGLFDERFFLYYEDVDLSVRAHNAGQRVVVVPEAVAWHSEESEGDLPQKTYFLVFSGLLFFSLHARGIWRLWLRVFMPIRRMRSSFRILFGRTPLVHAVHRAFNDFNHARKNKDILSRR